MTTIDHAAEARICINFAHKSPLNDPISQTYMMQAQVHATLALVEAQREANEQARIANLIQILDNAARLVASGNSHAGDYIALHQRINPLVMEGLGL